MPSLAYMIKPLSRMGSSSYSTDVRQHNSRHLHAFCPYIFIPSLSHCHFAPITLIYSTKVKRPQETVSLLSCYALKSCINLPVHVRSFLISFELQMTR